MKFAKYTHESFDGVKKHKRLGFGKQLWRKGIRLLQRNGIMCSPS